MRLVCPNCGAQYEVADDVIPDSGRDVQCSNCGHTWFEEPGIAAQPAPHQPEPEPIPDPEPTPEPEPEPEPEEAHEPEPEPEPLDQAEDTETPDDAPQPETGPERRTIDPEVARILREEREREEAVRHAEADSLESQPDLGLDDAASPDDQRSEEARRRMARLRGEESKPSGPAAAAAAAAATVAASKDGDQVRRDLLPDIDEINSTLQSDGEPGPAQMEDKAQSSRSGGFRRGFLLVVLLAVIAALVYVFAPQIGDAVPALADPLDAYVVQVNEWRLWLDATLQDLMAGMEYGPDAATDSTPTVSPEAPETPETPEAPTE